MFSYGNNHYLRCLNILFPVLLVSVSLNRWRPKVCFKMAESTCGWNNEQWYSCWLRNANCRLAVTNICSECCAADVVVTAVRWWVRRIREAETGTAFALHWCLIRRLDELICCDCRVIADELCSTLSVSKDSVRTIVKKLRFCKLCLRWVHECYSDARRRGKQAPLVFFTNAALEVRASCCRLSRRMEPGSTILNLNSSNSRWNGALWHTRGGGGGGRSSKSVRWKNHG